MVVSHNENVELEAELAEAKKELGRRKEEVGVLVEEMERMGRDLATRKTFLNFDYGAPIKKTIFVNCNYETSSMELIEYCVPGYKNIELQTTQLSELPPSIEDLENTIDELRNTIQASQTASVEGIDSSYQSLSLPTAQKLLAEREAELANLDRHLTFLDTALPRKTREAEAVERELSGLERKKDEAIALAKEAQRRKQDGESDGLEEMGRWYRSAETILRDLVETES